MSKYSHVTVGDLRAALEELEANWTSTDERTLGPVDEQPILLWVPPSPPKGGYAYCFLSSDGSGNLALEPMDADGDAL